jgi:hypothetical protein
MLHILYEEIDHWLPNALKAEFSCFIISVTGTPIGIKI